MNKEFEVHLLNVSGQEKSKTIAEAFDRLLEDLLKVCPPGRELAIVRTKLEEACFYAKKAMALQLENQRDNGNK